MSKKLRRQTKWPNTFQPPIIDTQQQIDAIITLLLTRMIIGVSRFSPDVTAIILEGDTVNSVGEIEFNKAYAFISEESSLVNKQSEKLVRRVSRFSPDVTDILLEGDAVNSVGEIELNKVDYICRVGQIIYNGKVPLYDTNSGKLTDFATHFSFTIDTQNRSTYGNGLAFFLAPVGFRIPPNSVGGFLGLFNSTTTDSSQTRIVSVEFDSVSNPEWDPPYEHVGINRNSISSLVTAPWNVTLHSGDPADAWIVYNSTSKNLSVFWSYNGGPNSSLSYQIDLKEVLPQWVTVGISAATGTNVERHTLESWEFNSSLDIKENREEQGREDFRTKELALATSNFSDDRKLGQGGFGGVYKGHLIDLDIPIAVKKFSRGSKQGKKEYITEVKIISMLRHRNLVQLIGWCHDQGEFLLVYEFMPNGSLDYHLFGKKNIITWALRYKIAVGFASALLYLHEEWDQCVVHRDIKSSNIMLDSSFNVKLGDFGLARLMDHGLGPQTTDLAGTLGYLAPEYVSTGRASKESDFWDCGPGNRNGRKSVDPLDKHSHKGLVEWVWDLYGNGEIVSGVDEKMKMDYEPKEVECLMTVGLWCAHPDRSLRPSIRQARNVLNFEADLPILPTKMPVAMYYAHVSHSTSSGEPLITDSSINVGR
ncbi:LOW QUALITY PROTEIN: hypothetical protein DH2020_037522 [Rehmannia glutinosa]|uniref:non-specific serine/threonine protein kinase n=1 Tax=Rehmannia glutinosa TaxID=99300 RepID=A0ABR0V190_REHGL